MTSPPSARPDSTAPSWSRPCLFSLFEGRPAARPVPRRPARRQPVTSTKQGPHRVSSTSASWAASIRAPAGFCAKLVHALLVKKDHAAAGKIVVLMGAVGTMRPEAEAAKDLEKFATPADHADAGRAVLRRHRQAAVHFWPTPTMSSLPRELVLIGKQFPLRGAVHEAVGAEVADDVRTRNSPATSPTSWSKLRREHNNSDIEV